jgi:hypothetical protein
MNPGINETTLSYRRADFVPLSTLLRLALWVAGVLYILGGTGSLLAYWISADLRANPPHGAPGLPMDAVETSGAAAIMLAAWVAGGVYVWAGARQSRAAIHASRVVAVLSVLAFLPMTLAVCINLMPLALNAWLVVALTGILRRRQ